MSLPGWWCPGGCTAAILALVAAGCADGPTSVPDGGGAAFGVATPFHRVLVNVADPAGAPVVGHIVTATNVQTGDYSLSRTRSNGTAVLELRDGQYLVHARNLTDWGPFVPQRLALAPLPDGAGLLATGQTEGRDRVGVLYDPVAAFQSVPLTPTDYSRLSASPPLVLTPTTGNLTIDLRYLAGGALTCKLLDSNGSPVSVAAPENVFLILPHGSGPLPPLTPDLAGLGYPRGILLGAATVPAGGNSCGLAGVPAMQGVPAVIESNTVRIGGEDRVFVQSIQSMGTGSIDATLIAEPRRARTGYLTEPLGDVTRGPDIGLVTHGWTATTVGDQTVPTDILAVAARFLHGGTYTLEVKFRDPRTGKPVLLRALAFCWTTGCELTTAWPARWRSSVEVTGTLSSGPPSLAGLVLWELTLPGVEVVEMRIYSGDDVAPDRGRVPSFRQGNGNTWIIAGD